MQRHFPDGTRYSRPQGGNYIWVEFPARVDTLRLRRDALKHHINTAPGSLFSAVKDRYRNCLRLSCSQPWSDDMDAALKTLGALVRQQL
jgi:DNA-binding transcriptional MocR family regulator